MQRRTIQRARTVDVRSLSEPERDALVARARPILDEIFADADDAFARRALFRGEGTRLALLEAGEGALVGFVSSCIELVDLDGVTHAVFDAGVFVDLRYRGGALAARIGLGDALRFKLRSPSTPLWYITAVSGPAPYRLFGRTVPVLHPHPELAAPDTVVRLVAEIARRRGMTPVGPWTVRLGGDAKLRDPERACSDRHRGDPFHEHYLRLNPGFASGTALLTCIPLDLANVLAGLVPPLRVPARVRHRRRFPSAPSAPSASAAPPPA